MTRQTALAAARVSAGHGRRAVIHEASLTVGRGEAVFVVGGNGSGRSTFIGALGGLVPRGGRVVVGGRLVPSGAPAAAVRAGLAVVPERRRLFPALSVADNLLLGLYSRGPRTVRAARRAPALADVYERFPVLAARRSQQAGTLSGGEQQMLALGRALVSRPLVLLLDEPFLGLAPAAADTMVEVVAALRAEGRGQLVVDDHPVRIAALADRVVVLEDGRLVDAAGTGPEEGPGRVSGPG